jgi:hypothetical protein
MNNSFLSIVEDYDNPERLLVRARIEGDIEAAFPEVDPKSVSFNEGSDYAFRVFLDRNYVSRKIKENVDRIDYDNFKSSVDDEWRERFYMDVWNVMYEYQQSTNPITITYDTEYLQWLQDHAVSKTS